MVWDILIGVAVGMLVSWLALLIGLAIVRPKGPLLKEALRLLPDLLRLLRRLAADNALPRGVRVRLALLMACLAIPIDLIPDYIPVIVYADDAIIVAGVLRSVVRRAGVDAVRQHLARHPGRVRRLVPPDRHQHRQPRRRYEVLMADLLPALAIATVAAFTLARQLLRRPPESCQLLSDRYAIRRNW